VRGQDRHGDRGRPRAAGRLKSRYSTRDPDGRRRLPIRLNLTRDERRNLVPVDWVSAVASEIVGRPEWHGRTYHLTPTPAVTARELEEAAAAYFGYSGVTFAGPDALAGGDLNETEAEFYQYVSSYETYWAAEPRFDAANTLAAAQDLPCPPVDAELVRRLVDFAVGDGWGGGGTGGRSRARTPPDGRPLVSLSSRPRSAG
jgi:hypothetical protein